MKSIHMLIWAGILLLAGCQSASKEEVPENKPVQVKLCETEMRTFKLPVRAVGRLTTTDEIKLSFKTGGIIRKLYTREGAVVKKGELLAALDLSEIEAQVNQAQIGLDKAQRDLTRAGNLYRDSVVTLEQYQNAESAFELAKAQMQIADFNREYSVIRAPAYGTVLKQLVEANEVIAPGYPAILFASTEGDWVVKVSLTDKDIVKFSLGDSAYVELDAFPQTRYPSEITELGTIADPVTGTYEAELRILRREPRFKTGFIARAFLFPTGTTRAVVVPLEALIGASDRRATVYVYRDGELSKRRVRTGPMVDSLIMVQEGLQPGELVVTEGAKYIREDSRVNPVNLENLRKP
jgi:RND family efflux transporter MFP subunit